MKVLIVATEDYYGAGKAAMRLYEAYKQHNNEVYFLVKNKISEDANVLKYSDIVPSSLWMRMIIYLKRLSGKFKKEIKTFEDFSFFGAEDEMLNVNMASLVKNLPFVPEIIITTWVSRFLNAKYLYQLQLYTKAKLIAYPMDMSLFTGGCHYAWDCDGYESECKDCPAIINLSKKEFAFKNLKKKIKYFDGKLLKPVAASDSLWLQMRKSVLFKNFKSISKVLIPINEAIFNSNDRNNAKAALGYAESLKIIFFGSSFTDEKRKGLSQFVLAINELHKIIINEGGDIVNYLVLIGGNKPVDIELLSELPLNYFFTGYINEDKKLSMIYQAADVFVNTSLQDSGPMMINEAIMCGTPVVSFEVGVVNDLIIDGFSGYKVANRNVSLLGQYIYRVLNDKRPPDFNKKISEFGVSKMGYANFPFELFHS